VERPTLKRLLIRLRQLREVHGLTQEAFAEMSGITYKYYQQIEQGRKPELRLSTLERLAKAYGIEVYQLLAPEFPETKLAKKRKQDDR
jgi:transcriptional regulator with XRE-family HTH domain